jgi:hypothetical protein
MLNGFRSKGDSPISDTLELDGASERFEVLLRTVFIDLGLFFFENNDLTVDAI